MYFRSISQNPEATERLMASSGCSNACQKFGDGKGEFRGSLACTLPPRSRVH